MDVREFIEEWNNGNDRILVHTSGSTGKPKELLVEKKRMLASARITCDYLGLKAGDTTLLCMPIEFIAGKMVVVRSIERNLELIDVKPSNHPLANVEKQIDFAAMVPSQVYGSLQNPIERNRLQQIKNLIIGGGAIPVEMENELKSFPNAIWSTYGMTETLSHIALRRINGDNASLWYTPLDGVDICTVNSENKNNDIGQLCIDAPHICESQLITNDIVEIKTYRNKKLFRIIGRTDNVICSGGIKIHIEDVEEKLQSYISTSFCVSKRKDPKFGEVAVLLLEKPESWRKDKFITKTKEICESILPLYSIPKDYIIVDKVPHTGTGKIDRAKALTLAQ